MARARRRFVTVAALAVVAACGRTASAPVALEHEAYVWQRAWTGAVRASTSTASPALGGLRVLTAEVDAAGAVVWPDVDASALAGAGRPVTAVVRIDGSRPPAGWDPGPVLDRVAAWQHAGVDVAGVEIDHDCATAALAGYARWLEATIPVHPERTLRQAQGDPSTSLRASGLGERGVERALRWSITALPTWAGSPALADVAAAVDELVVQVHAVQAPRLFERAQARRWLDAFAAAVPGARLRVALPTYQVEVGGELLASDPAEVAALVRDLERRPIAGLEGVVWFRLPVAGDRASWAAPTLDAVIAGAPLAPRVLVRLVERGPDLHDVVLVNTGTVDGPWPPIRLGGALTAADLVAGYTTSAAGLWTPPRRALAAGAETVVGWATGKDLTLDAR